MTASTLPRHYETLRIERCASAQEIRAAWRKLAQEFHPDRYQGEGDGSALMAQINQAYETLSDTQRRIRYDTALRVQEGRDRPVRPQHAIGARTLEKVFGWPAYTVVGTLSAGIAAVAWGMMRPPAGMEAASVTAPVPLQAATAVAPPVAVVVAQSTDAAAAPAPTVVLEPVVLVAARQLETLERTAAPARALQPVADPGIKLVAELSMRQRNAGREPQASAQ